MRAALSALTMAAAILATAPAHAGAFDLEYNASILNVVNLGRVTLKGSIGAAGYNASASVQTAGFARLFDDTKISSSAAGKVGPNGLTWLNYELSHSYAKKFRSVSMRRTGDGVTVTINPAYRDLGSPPASAAQQNIGRDPVTTFAEMGRAIAASGKCAGTFPTYDGKQYYLMSLSPKAAGNYKGGGYDGKALICWLRYTPVAGFKMSASEIAKIPTAEIWFAAPGEGGFAAPLRVEVPTPFGAARLDLAGGAGV